MVRVRLVFRLRLGSSVMFFKFFVHWHIDHQIAKLLKWLVKTPCFAQINNYWIFTCCCQKLCVRYHSCLICSLLFVMQAFYRRSLRNTLEYKCAGKGDCAILPGKRNTCAACRFKKCINVGMSFSGLCHSLYMIISFEAQHCVRIKGHG